MPIIDAHSHIYSPDRKTYPTIPEPWEPGEPASADDLKPKMDVVGVDRVVFIQTSTFYGYDNRYVMNSAKAHADWACGVITLNPDDASHINFLEDAVKNSNIRGIRGTVDSINRISSPNVYRLWTKAMQLGIPVNCMVMDDLERVPEIERIAEDLGDLKIVLDHCFMLNTRHQTKETLLALERLSKQPNIYAKLTSGTHGSYRVYPHVDMHDPLKRVISAFGPARCVWGSNFPNALWSKGDSYAQNLHLFVKELGLSLPDKADILGGTAMGLWFPKEHTEATSRACTQEERTEREVIRTREPAVDNLVQGDEFENSPPEDIRAAHVASISELFAEEYESSVKTGRIGQSGGDVEDLIDIAEQLSTVLRPITPVYVRRNAPKAVREGMTENLDSLGKVNSEPAPARKFSPKTRPETAAVKSRNSESASGRLARRRKQQGKVSRTEQLRSKSSGDADLLAIQTVTDRLSAMLSSVEQLRVDAANITRGDKEGAAADDRSSAG